MTKVSVVVPVYNVENYLHRSIQSLQKQTLKDIEIILVHDGGTDSSLNICREYSEKDSRIKVIDKVNGGVSSARNEGIKIATGEYIGFVDPDDWIKEDMYENMYNQAISTKSDIVMCNYIMEKKGAIKNEGEYVIDNMMENPITGNDIIYKVISKMISSADLNSNGQTIMGTVWRMLIKKDILINNKIEFKLGIPLMEDLLFCIEVLLKVNKLCIDKNQYYHYVVNEDSAVTAYRKDSYKWHQKVYSELEKILIHEKKYEALKNNMEIRYINMGILGIANEAHVLSDESEIKKIRNIYKICCDKKLNSILKRIQLKKCTLRKKSVLLAMKYKIALYLYMYYIALNKIIK